MNSSVIMPIMVAALVPSCPRILSPFLFLFTVAVYLNVLPLGCFAFSVNSILYFFFSFFADEDCLSES